MYIYKAKSAAARFATYVSCSIRRFVLAATPARIYLSVFLLGFPFHPRIVGRLPEVAEYVDDNNFKIDEGKWENFVKFTINDHKLAGIICWMLLAPIAMVATATYKADPVVSRIGLVAIVPPIFGIAHASCTRWHLESVYREPDAPLNWCKATVRNSHSPFINTPALLSAPFAWMGWSAISFTTLFLTILFRGFPILPCPNPQGSPPGLKGLLELVSLVFACHSEEQAQALVHFSIALCTCLTITVIAGGIHFCITAVYFTRLCLPQPVSPMRNADVTSSSTAREQDQTTSHQDNQGIAQNPGA